MIVTFIRKNLGKLFTATQDLFIVQTMISLLIKISFQDDKEEEFSKIIKIKNNWFWIGTGNIYKQLRLEAVKYLSLTQRTKMV